MTPGRAAWAALLGAAGAVLLVRGQLPLPAAVSAGAGGLTLAVWRTRHGAGAGFLLLLVAAALTVVLRIALLEAVPRAVLLPLLALELYGVITVLLAAARAESGLPGRRLLGAWLGSSGIVAIGLAALAVQARGAGSALLAGALAYRLGAVPAFAWAPLLMRHDDAALAGAGLLGWVAAGAVLVWLRPRLDPGTGVTATLATLGVVATLWGGWHACRQWRRDPRCARSYGAVTAGGGLLLWLAAMP